MTVAELLLEGLRLMGIGMGIVFSFLILLVGVLRVMSLVAGRLAPEDALVQAAAIPAPLPSPDSELVAVVSAAITRYRRDRSHR